MKNLTKALLVFCGMLSFTGLFSQTTGTLTFTFTTPKHTSGCYVTSDCRYVLAAWIESGNGTSTGTFVKTKLRYVGSGTDDHLPTWGTAAGCTFPTAVTSGGCNTTDATTGATQTTFPSRTFTWDGKNCTTTANGTTVADGAYQVVIQETWGHTASTVTRRFAFTKGAAIDSQTPTADTNFTGISLNWTPTALATSETGSNKPTASISPNPSNGIINLDFKNPVNYIQVFDMSGELVYSETVKFSTLPKKSLDLSKLNNGNYILQVSNAYGSSNYKIIIAK